MRRRIDIDRALADPNLLGAALGDLTPWKVWRVVLRAAFALGLGTDEERAIFEEISGGRPLPAKRVRELWAIVARRGGKSRMAAAIGVYLALWRRSSTRLHFCVTRRVRCRTSRPIARCCPLSPRRAAC
jgi:hypothetical protein